MNSEKRKERGGRNKAATLGRFSVSSYVDSESEKVPLDKRVGKETAATVSGSVRRDTLVSSKEIVLVEQGLEGR